MYFATLIEGQTYGVGGEFNESFVVGEEKKVSKALYEYLEGNPQFELRIEKKASAAKVEEKE
jgi:hypothetical protein